MRIDGPQLTSSLSLNGTTITDLNVFVTTASFNGLTGSTATTGSNLFKGTQTISGSILPAVNNTYDLGSPTYQFRHVYISTGSLYIDGTKVLGSTSQELQITTDVGQSFKILETGSDSITLQSVDGNITLTNSGGGDVVLDPNTGVIQLKGPTTIYAGYKFLSSDGNAIHFGNGIAVTGSIVSTVTPLVSGSSQISYTGLSNVPSGIVSGSSQLTSSYDSRYVLSGSITQTTWDNIANKPVGITSGSSQIDITGTTGYSTFSSSISNSISSLSGSIATTTLNTKNRVDSIEAKTGSYATTGSNTFQGNQTITGSLYISANLVVQGSSSLQDVTGSNVYIGTNKINLNTNTPAIRFGGISVFDSGSNLGESGSLLWDSQLNHWVYQHPASSGAPYKSAMLISGPKNSGSLGDEIGLTTNVIQKAVGDDHIGDSIMTETGGGIGISGSLSVTGSIISTTTALVSGSNQIVYSGLTGIPSGIVSGSSQVIYSGLTGIPSGIISGSAQLPSGLVSGSSQILNGSNIWSGSAQLPSGIVSGSVQIVNLGFATTSSVITASSVRNVDTFTATANQSTFTTSQGYSVGLIDVFVNGSKLAASDYVALNGTSVLLNVAAEGGETVELYAYFQALNSNNALRTVTTATATASQTVFTGITYTQGLIEVYYNGSRLTASEYTATNGTSVTLSTAANVGDILDFIAYNYTVGAFVGLSGTGTANYLPKYASTSSLTNSSIIDNSGAVTINGTLVVTGTTLVSGSSQISYTGLSNIPSGIVSGSSQVTGYGFATTGSNTFQGNQTINGSMVITGSLTAQQYIVSSSVTYLTESFASGSHKFGDSSDDTHQFTGSVYISSGSYFNVGRGADNSYPFNVTSQFAKTDTSGRGLMFLGSNEAIASNPFGLVVTVTGAASLAGRTVTIGTTDFGLANGGTLNLNNTLYVTGSNIGIGTSTPNSSLTVSGGALSFPSNMSSGFVGYSLFQNGSKLTIAGGSGGIQFNNTANSSGLVSIFDNGNVLLGNTGTDAGFKLNVIGRGNFGGVDTPYIDFKSTDTPGVGWQYKQISFKDTSNNELYAIGYHYPNLKFDVSGSRVMTLTNTGHGALGTITPSSWGSGTTALQVGTTAGFWSRASDGLTVLTSNSYFNGSADIQITTGTANRMYFLNGNTYLERAASASAGAGTSWTTSVTITNNGYVYLGPGFGATNHRIDLARAEGGNVLVVSGYDGSANDTAIFYGSAGTSGNAAASSMWMSKNSSTSRSISAGGTINASGADYAEYMLKATTDTINKGDIVGVNINGKLTNIFNDAISFVVKSTDPSYVGGDNWFNEEKRPSRTTDQTEEEFAPIMEDFESRLEVERQKVDRIAFSGQVPVNVTGATVGDYIIPISTEDGKITGQAITNPSFDQYKISVGKVWKIMEDGRAFIAVKIG